MPSAWSFRLPRPELARGLAVGLVAYTLAFALRFGAEQSMQGLPFVTFFVAVVVTALLGGWQPAALVTLASAATAWAFFLPPGNNGAVAISFFLLVCAVQTSAIEALHELAVRLDGEAAAIRRLLADERLLREELRVRTAEGMRFVGELLVLQAQAGQSDFGRLALRVSQVAEMQRTLHAAPMLEEGLAEFLGGIARRRLHGAGVHDIALTVKVAGPHPGFGALVPLGLVVAEAVGNALTHGFRADQQGHLLIGLGQGRDGRMELRVRDDGRGLDQRRADGLGVVLMRGMAARLLGDFYLEPMPGAPGVEVRVAFPLAA